MNDRKIYKYLKKKKKIDFAARPQWYFNMDLFDINALYSLEM